MELSKTHMLLVAICVMVLAVPLTVTEVDAADSYDIDPTISDAGYVEKQASLFYYAKFVDGGITSSSPSNDSPTKGVGLTMYDKSVFAQLKGLDETKQYILTISEYSSADANDATASVKVNLNLESVNAFIYYSVGEGIAKVYNKGTEIAGAEFTGTFTTTTGNQIFKIVLSDSSNNEIANRTVSDIAHFTHIAYAEILDFDETYGDNDLIQGTAKGYGYVTSKKDQAGYTATALSNFSYGKYVFAVYITNIENAVLKISDGDKTYNVTESEIHLNTTATSAAMNSGMGIVIVSEETLDDNGISNINTVKLTIGDSDNVYDSFEFTEEKSKTNYTPVIAVGIGAVAVIAIAAIVIVPKLKG